MAENKVKARIDIPNKYKWSAESVYSSHQAWEKELSDIQAYLTEMEKLKDRVKDGPGSLANALHSRDSLIHRINTALMYALISHEVEKTDQSTAGMPGKAQSVLGKVLASVSYIEPALLEIGEEKLERWSQENKQLAIYAHYFDNLFRKQAHVRSAEVEELYGMLADPFSSVGTTFGMLTDADFKFKPAIDGSGQEVEVSQGNFYKIMASPDRQLRRTAWENHRDTYLAFKNTLANNLVTSIKQNYFMARTRRHPATLEASLFEQNIPIDVFHNLIDTFKKNLPTWHRYFSIRKKALGVDSLQPYDMWAPLVQKRPTVTYEQAVDWICEGLAPMGREYTEVVRRGCLEERWVDVYPNQGKTSGAFSYGTMGTHPFIVMSFTDEIFSLSTLAHELGHSMHSYLTWKNQPVIYSDYGLFVAEVASNFHQAMVRAYLLEKETDPAFQISLIEEAMANFYRYFLTMPTLARFELETHQRIERGEGLSADEMISLMVDLLQEAYGDTVQFDRQRGGIIWATFGHLYADYYVYQYATGISGAHALSHRILTGEPGSVEDYLSFLKAGSSMYPLDALKVAGVDLTTPRPVEETFAVLSSMVDKLEKLLN